MAELINKYGHHLNKKILENEGIILPTLEFITKETNSERKLRLRIIKDLEQKEKIIALFHYPEKQKDLKRLLDLDKKRMKKMGNNNE